MWDNWVCPERRGLAIGLVMDNTYFGTKYDSARDEIIALLSDTTEGYGIDSTGDVDAPCGYVQWVIVDSAIAVGCLTDPMVMDLVTTYGVTATDLIGNWVVVWDDRGFVYVLGHDSPDDAARVFNTADDDYAAWYGDNDI